jgi:Trk-type K+ transport system membrane component
MQLSYVLQMAVVIITALGGTGFVVSLLLLWFAWGGDPQFVTTSFIYTVASGVVTFVGLIVLKVSKPPDEENAKQD